jgi:hypothetical protein
MYRNETPEASRKTQRLCERSGLVHPFAVGLCVPLTKDDNNVCSTLGCNIRIGTFFKTLHTERHLCVGKTKTRSHKVHSYSSCLPHHEGLDHPAQLPTSTLSLVLYICTHMTQRQTYKHKLHNTMQLVVISAIRAPRSSSRPSFSGTGGSGEKGSGPVVCCSSVCMLVLRVGCCCPNMTDFTDI